MEHAGKIAEQLRMRTELFDEEKLEEFNRVTKGLEQNIRTAQQQSRKLSIGIVGAVKAGKSSFLNACVFDGKEFLPKAATPMTAALTKITYSETPKALIHFYTAEDWQIIVAASEKYDAELQKAYDKYLQQQQQLMAQNQMSGLYSPLMASMSLEEYERKLYRCVSETNRGAKELTRMVSDPSILEKLGCTDTLEGDVIGLLNNYVGAGGTYTPIVSYVELQTDSPDMKELEIVDTPGLNDPVLSRGIVTKQFLRSCDVVLLLSPCSQFMDSRTITLMASSLPDAGVREAIVIGSKFDSGILNESTNQDFRSACKKAMDSYQKQFHTSIAQVRSSGRCSGLVSKINESVHSPLFVSSICFAITQKQKAGEPLDENEKLVLHNLSSFSGFEVQFLPAIGGISKVKNALNEVLKRKAEIIEGKNDSLLDNARRNHLQILDGILQEVVSSRTVLEAASADELREEVLNIQNVIDTSRSKLIYTFKNAETKCAAKIEQICPQLTLEAGQHQDIEVQSMSREKSETVNAGFLGLRKDLHTWTETEHIAGTDVVINNIREYAAKCQVFVNSEFQLIFNREEFAQHVVEIVLDAFQKSGREFDADEIRLPLKNVLDKISIPHMELDYSEYIDEVNTRFKNGYAENEEIHQLKELQARLLLRVETALAGKLAEALSTIEDQLEGQAVRFADNIRDKLCKMLERLQKQVAEREEYLAKYAQFADEVRAHKQTFWA